MRSKDRILNDRVVNAVAELSSRLTSNEFVDPGDFKPMVEEYKQLNKDVNRKIRRILSILGLTNKKLIANIKDFNELYENYPDRLRLHNEDLACSESIKIGERINPIEGYDLDEQQLYAISYDVRSRLIIAGAGTGKTTTTVGLVKHLLDSGKASPEEILALSFTNASVNDLNKRIIAETGQRVDVNTFHRLGLKIIASSVGKIPKITNIKIDEFIAEEIKRRRNDPNYVRDLNEFIAYDFESVGDESRFSNSTEMIEYLRENPLITLRGEKVKSFGEADIANYLAMNGIPYTYEEAYCVDTADSRYGQYHPDFHINGTDIFIEYFGIDRDGNVAKFMTDTNPNASEEYRNGIEWKRQIHQKNGTCLIELYAYERMEGTLIENLESKLKTLNVDTVPESPESIFDRTFNSDNRMLKSISLLLTTAILLIKGYGKPWDEVYPRTKDIRKWKSLKRIESVLKPLFDAYQSALKENEEIDFEDMLNMAAGCIREEKYVHPYKYVVVDEYQDLSRSRYNLLKTLRESKDYHLFCVGDDWQSIYRFNGCDVSYILDFEKYWGPSVICKIEKTYRFSGELLRKSSEFICRNSHQYHKNLIGMKEKKSDVFFICKDDDSKIRNEIGKKVSLLGSGQKVLFLGRYNHDVRLLKGEGFDWKQNISDNSKTITYELRPDLDMKFMTIHSSKGLQADVIFSINNNSGKYGFPSIREEPMIISMLLGGYNSQIEEERRLFYVAMTRAKETAYIISHKGHQSIFFKELFPRVDDYGKKIEMTCPLCGGVMVLRTSYSGHMFYGCSNYHSKGCKFTRNCEPIPHQSRRNNE